MPPWRTEGRRPTPEEREKFEASLTPEQRERYQQMVQQMRQRMAEGGGPGGPGGSGGGAPRKPEGPTTSTVYLLQSSAGAPAQGKPVLKPVTVKAGITDGTNTEILDGLKEGDVVVTGTSSAPVAGAAEPTRNPFMPFGGGGGRR